MRPFFSTTLLLIFMVPFLSGCSSLTLYQSETPHNLTIKVKTQSVNVSLDVFNIDNMCQTEYQGTLLLDKELVELGIPTTESVSLVVGFSDSSFWGSSSSFMSHEVILTPHIDFRYEIDVYYLDNIYNVTAFEVNPENGIRRELEDKGLTTCR